MVCAFRTRTLGDGECTLAGHSLKPMHAWFEQQMTKLDIGYERNYKVVGSSRKQTDFGSRENATTCNALGDGEFTRSSDSCEPMPALIARQLGKLAMGNATIITTGEQGRAADQLEINAQVAD